MPAGVPLFSLNSFFHRGSLSRFAEQGHNRRVPVRMHGRRMNSFLFRAGENRSFFSSLHLDRNEISTLRIECLPEGSIISILDDFLSLALEIVPSVFPP